MQCSKCQTDNQKDSRFCIDCGNPLAIVEPIDDGIRRSYSANSRSPLANKKYAQGKDSNLAVILSVFIPGLGQFYNGDILKGVVMLVGSIIFTFFLPPIGMVAFRVWSSVDGYQVAKGNQSLWK